MDPSGPVFALAGRRIDVAGAVPPRFPLPAVPAVRAKLAALFAARRPAALVCSAACGADLVALEEASRLGIRCRIVLPFEAVRFRETSVTDRPGDWGPGYDSLVAAAGAAGDLVVLDARQGGTAYAAANRAIVAEALSLSGDAAGPPTAILVWEGASRGADDGTEDFRTEATRAGLEELSILSTG